MKHNKYMNTSKTIQKSIGGMDSGCLSECCITLFAKEQTIGLINSLQ